MTAGYQPLHIQMDLVDESFKICKGLITKMNELQLVNAKRHEFDLEENDGKNICSWIIKMTCQILV